MEPILQTEQLNHLYSAGTPFQHSALVDVDFCAYRGEYLGIIGRTGSGKSTLVQHFNGLLKPTSGRCCWRARISGRTRLSPAQPVSRSAWYFSTRSISCLRKQSTRTSPSDLKTWGWTTHEVDRRVREAAEFVGLSEDVLEQSPFALSGGQKRRVAIAGVIAMEPSVLILDEPTAGLDPLGVEQVLSNIQAYHKAKNATIIMVSHSMEEMARTADRLVVIHEGKIPFQGPPKEVFAHGGELENMGLGVPQMTRVFSRLRALGADIDPAVYTVAQAKAALLAALGKGAE